MVYRLRGQFLNQVVGVLQYGLGICRLYLVSLGIKQVHVHFETKLWTDKKKYAQTGKEIPRLGTYSMFLQNPGWIFYHTLSYPTQ